MILIALNPMLGKLFDTSTWFNFTKVSTLARQFLLGVLLLGTSPSLLAKVPENLEDIQREVRIVADVITSALREELRSKQNEQARITTVEAEYLAQQGAVISLTISTPWLTVNKDGETSIRINGALNVPEIPAFVENILQDLEIDIAPYEPEALEDLRELRTDQRKLRLEQRKVRSMLRTQRRALVRTKDSDARDDIEQEIKQLEEELGEVDAEYENLAAAIDAQYEKLRDYRGTTPPQTPPKVADIDKIVTATACDYGATLKSLPNNEYLTIILRRKESSQYFSFKMDDINDCSQRKIGLDTILERAYRYAGLH